MNSYQRMLSHVLEFGQNSPDRTGTGTRSVFGYQFRHNLQEGFPLLTTKRIHTRSVIEELLWFLRGETNVRSLNAKGVTIWDEWADEKGELGPVYGKQWRSWLSRVPTWKADGGIRGIKNEDVDQIANLIRDLRANPHSRRHIVTAWNPAEVPIMALPPCHLLWQCHVSFSDKATSNDDLVHGRKQSVGRLSLHLYQRSADLFLGVPFNIASYAFLCHMLAEVCGYEAGDLIISFGDLHIYRNHFDQVMEQLGREPKPLPTLRFERKLTDIDQFTLGDFIIEGYDPHPSIKAPISV